MSSVVPGWPSLPEQNVEGFTVWKNLLFLARLASEVVQVKGNILAEFAKIESWMAHWWSRSSLTEFWLEVAFVRREPGGGEWRSGASQSSRPAAPQPDTSSHLRSFLRQSHIGCICSTFLHSVLSNVSSNFVPQKMQIHIGCICLARPQPDTSSHLRSILTTTLPSLYQLKSWRNFPRQPIDFKSYEFAKVEKTLWWWIEDFFLTSKYMNLLFTCHDNS